MTSHDRRDVLRIGGLAVGLGVVVAACRSGDDAPPAAVDDVATDTEPVAPGTSDLSLLNTALSLEILVDDTYRTGFELALAQSDAVVEVATLLQQHHVEHRATLTALIEAAEGEPFETANPVVKAALVDPSLMSVAVERDFVRLVHDLELACAQLYVHMATALDDPAVRSAAMSIGAVASRRATVLDLLGDLGNERVATYPTDNPLPSDAIVPS
ncbi:MAG TPA: ferritin-like domain-containing protein [Acidimicrobiales bacterium]